MIKPMNLLFVDDEEQLRLLVKDQLTLEGYKVETADDGDVAIDLLRKNPRFDVILLDVRMPRVSGIEVL